MEEGRRNQIKTGALEPTLGFCSLHLVLRIKKKHDLILNQEWNTYNMNNNMVLWSNQICDGRIVLKGQPKRTLIWINWLKFWYIDDMLWGFIWFDAFALSRMFLSYCGYRKWRYSTVQYSIAYRVLPLYFFWHVLRRLNYWYKKSHAKYSIFLSFSDFLFGFDDSLDLTKCLQQIEFPSFS